MASLAQANEDVGLVPAADQADEGFNRSADRGIRSQQAVHQLRGYARQSEFYVAMLPLGTRLADRAKRRTVRQLTDGWPGETLILRGSQADLDGGSTWSSSVR